MRAAVITAVLILAGCTATDTDPKPKPEPSATIPAAKPMPKAGECFAKEVPDLDDLAPDLGSKVDCTRPHIYEVSAVVDVPERLLKGKSPKELVTQRNKFARVANDDAVRTKLLRYAGVECGQAHIKATGLSKLEFNGKSAREARVDLLLRDASGWLNMLDAGNWAEGNTKFLCTIRYNKHRADNDYSDPAAIRSKSGTPSIQDFLKKGFPLKHRQCQTIQADGDPELASCEKQHHGEMFLVFDAEVAFGKDFVKSISSDPPTEEQRRKLRKPCVDALPTILGKGYDKDLTAEADPGPIAWTESGGGFPAICIVVARDKGSDLPGGTVFGDSTDVSLVPEEGQAV